MGTVIAHALATIRNVRFYFPQEYRIILCGWHLRVMDVIYAGVSGISGAYETGSIALP